MELNYKLVRQEVTKNGIIIINQIYPQLECASLVVLLG